mmetsp:Transcript_26886/g.56437  ORF Transcript_26886/g.56437 Transcript_26886/m.56437 type:complete len:423 (+) Transcript_26886:58-1326(+)
MMRLRMMIPSSFSTRKICLVLLLLLTFIAAFFLASVDTQVVSSDECAAEDAGAPSASCASPLPTDTAAMTPEEEREAAANALFQTSLRAWNGTLIDRVPHDEMTYQRFVKDYQSKRRPVVVTGMYAASPLTEGVDDAQWGWPALRDRFGDVTLETRVASKEESNSGQKRGCSGTGLCEGRPIRLGELLDRFFLNPRHDDDDDDDGERNQSIAERLALLSSAMEQSDDDDDNDDDDANETLPPKINTKSATSETLTTLLTQALSSNDMAQLNIVLQVTNRRMVENTVRELQILDAEKLRKADGNQKGDMNDGDDKTKRESGYILMLMGHLVRRMARRHSVVVSLGVWVKAILAAVARGTTSRYHLRNGTRKHDDNGLEERIAEEAKEMALKLGPLKNFLNERVECFPQLLRLEGRLALLSQQL